MNLLDEIKKRELPPLKSREEMMEIMQREVYGYLPRVDFSTAVSEPQIVGSRFCCGRVEQSFVTMTITVGSSAHSFRIDRLLHNDGKKRPLVLHANFHPMSGSRYFPIEEMSEYDADFLLFNYTDVTSDDSDFSTGLAPLLLPNGQDGDSVCGKIGIWAWAAMRVLDYGITLPGTDRDNIAIVGHSRLGKTALYTAMLDERFKFAFSNAAGCAGDALAHGGSGLGRSEFTHEKGELISDIVRVFPYWFCKNYRKYADKNFSDEFDQHYLLATISPRYVMVGSCDLDAWADPNSEQLCALAASEAWQRQGMDGLVGGDDRYLCAGESLIDGHVGYFMIHSNHFLSRHSWRRFMEFVERHRAD